MSNPNNDRVKEPVNPAEVVEMLRKASAPEPMDPDEAHRQLAYMMTLRIFYPHNAQPKLNPAAVEINRAVLALRKWLPGYIAFWAIAEDMERVPDCVRKRAQKLREMQSYLGDDLFPPLPKRNGKAGWRKVGEDSFVYEPGSAPWHETAVNLWARYRSLVDPTSGISRDGAAVKFIQSALCRAGERYHSLDAIEKALSRAMDLLAKTQSAGN